MTNTEYNRQLHDGEPLLNWIDRLAAIYGFTPEQRPVLYEISKQAYIRGCNDTHDINNKYNKTK